MVLKNKTKKRLVLIDSLNLIHRAYHSFPDTLRSSEGQQLNAAYGFTVMLIRVLEQLEPDYIACAFDLSGPTWRHAEMQVYKKNRKEVDSELKDQIPVVKEIVKSLNIPILEYEGFEADDIAGTISEWVERGKWKEDDIDLIIVSGDRDILQLVGDHTRVWMPQKSFKEMKMFNRGEVIIKYGFEPGLIPDFKALVGDASDNIPGVSGIGEVSGLKLIGKYGSIDNVFSKIDELEGRVAKKLAGQEEIAYLSKKVATIVRDVPLDTDLQACTLKDFNMEEAVELFTRLEFRSLLAKVYKLRHGDASTMPVNPQKQENSPQLDMFAVQGEGDSTRAESLKVVEVDSNKIIEQLSKLKDVFFYYEDGFVWILTNPDEVSKVELTEDVAKELLKPERNLWGFTLKAFYKKILTFDFIEKVPHHIYDLEVLAYLVAGDTRNFAFSSVVFDYLKKDLPQYEFKKGDPRAQEFLTYLPDVKDAILTKLKSLEFEGQYVWSRLKLEETFPGEVFADNPIAKLFFYIENPTVFVLSHIERSGVQIDNESLVEKRKKFQKKLKSIEKEIFESVGHEFNIASPKQLADVLFNELNLPKSKRTKTGYSTNEDALRVLIGSHPLPKLVLEYREVAKLLSTYIEGLSREIQEDGRIRTTYNHTNTSTGRLSSVEPNLQNIPIKTELGQEIRSLIVCGENNLLVSADYSQIELRVLAHQCEDPAFIKTFKDGRDIHTETAARIFQKELSEVTPNERRIGKTVNFGIVYGQTAFGLSQQLDIPTKEASEYINSYFKAYPKVENYMNSTINFLRKNNYVETIFGRRRYIYGINSKNRMAQMAAQREAINMPIQGAATGDIMKFAMVKLMDMILAKYKQKVKMVMQVHDELVFEVSDVGKVGIGKEKIPVKDLEKPEVEGFVKDLKNEMEAVVNLDVDLLAEVSVGCDWAAMEDLVF